MSDNNQPQIANNEMSPELDYSSFDYQSAMSEESNIGENPSGQLSDSHNTLAPVQVQPIPAELRLCVYHNLIPPFDCYFHEVKGLASASKTLSQEFNYEAVRKWHNFVNQVTDAYEKETGHKLYFSNHRLPLRVWDLNRITVRFNPSVTAVAHIMAPWLAPTRTGFRVPVALHSLFALRLDTLNINWRPDEVTGIDEPLRLMCFDYVFEVYNEALQYFKAVHTGNRKLLKSARVYRVNRIIFRIPDVKMFAGNIFANNVLFPPKYGVSWKLHKENREYSDSGWFYIFLVGGVCEDGVTSWHQPVITEDL